MDVPACTKLRWTSREANRQRNEWTVKQTDRGSIFLLHWRHSLCPLCWHLLCLCPCVDGGYKFLCITQQLVKEINVSSEGNAILEVQCFQAGFLLALSIFLILCLTVFLQNVSLFACIFSVCQCVCCVGQCVGCVLVCWLCVSVCWLCVSVLVVCQCVAVCLCVSVFVCLSVGLVVCQCV